MADYKLSELNSIDTIRSDDLLHVRVKKRPEMLGDEDRRMTYQDFLASFKLERFVQIAGSTMTGDLGIVKLLYGGKVVFNPTGSSEINIGDVLKTFKINANGLKLTIADTSRSATVYHTLNKPSPNELGMRTNEENDARYARLAVTNNFSIRQAIVTDGEQLTLKKATNAGASYIQGRDANNQQTWYVGQGNANNTNVYLYNHATGSMLTLDATASFNKTLRVMGQVQPSDFSNLDARYFTQTVANQKFAQLAGDNTFSGSNIFTNFVVKKNANAITLQNVDTTAALYIQAKKSDGTRKWYIGNDTDENTVNIYNYLANTQISLGNTIAMSRTVQITGQVQPSDWTNIDSRYIPAGTLSNLAKLSDVNTFRSAQVIKQNGPLLQLRNTIQDKEVYLSAHNADDVRRWYIGNGETADPTRLIIHNDRTATTIYMGSDFLLNKTVRITGQVQPSDWSNLDDRYYVKSATDAKYLWSASRALVEESDGGVAWNQPSGIYVETIKGGGSSRLVLHLFANTLASTPTAQLRFDYRNSGLWYRTARDRQGFEAEWSKVYTEAQRPNPSEIGAYTKAETDQKIAQAVSDSTDLNKIYPVGIVTWFNSNVDPNTALPGLTWTYLNNGVGRTIRIAAANGSDVATTGGSDSVTLAVGNLPSHTHSFSATTSSFDYGTKGTNSTGGHTHSVSGTTSAAGNHAHHLGLLLVNGGDALYGYTTIGNGLPRTLDWLDRGDNKFPNTNTTGDHTHTWSGTTSWAGDHSHSVGIGAHSHTVRGNTGSTGSGSAFSVTNQFYKLMAWVRTA